MSMRSTLLLPKLISAERELVRLVYLEVHLRVMVVLDRHQGHRYRKLHGCGGGHRHGREGAGRSSGGGPIVP